MSYRLSGFGTSLVACAVMVAPTIVTRAQEAPKEKAPSTMPVETLQRLWSSATQPSSRPALAPVEPPKTLAELRDLEKKVRSVTSRGRAATVGIRSRGGQGSGVIISKDGYVLTAAHVIGRKGMWSPKDSGDPDRDFRVWVRRTGGAFGSASGRTFLASDAESPA